MNVDLVNQLLYAEESPTLDFKRDQYAFAKASDEDKSELLKDIVGFANTWRQSEAYILIGVEEVVGKKKIVHGISEHLADHSLQQFVNNQTNRPVQFGYEACEVEGKQIGVIRIAVQKRPIYLKRDYGKLKKGEVYVRRGTSTTTSKPADPDEIASMGSEPTSEAKEASIVVRIAIEGSEKNAAEEIAWSAERCSMPESDEIPTIEPPSRSMRLPGGGSISLGMSANDIFNQPNPDFYSDVAVHESYRRLTKPIKLVIENIGDVPASNVRVEISESIGQGFMFFEHSELPSKPERKSSPIASLAGMDSLSYRKITGQIDLSKNDDEMTLEVDCGSLQPGRRIWTDETYLGIGSTCTIELHGKIYASNLTKPHEFTLKINADIQETTMTVEELIKLSKQFGSERD